MKQQLLLPVMVVAMFVADAQNVGIGTSAPVKKLHVEGTTYLNGNVGIGTTTSRFPLSFGATTGQKISFFDDGNAGGANYGIGIAGGLLQVHSYTNVDDIAFGFGSSASFNQRMRIINNGEYGMQLNGRIELKNGTFPLNNNYGPGIWLFKGDNSSVLGFMGTQNNQNIGFFGGPAGWGFTYDAINSRVGIGNPTPNAPLSFSALLGKKITLYPGSSGDAGFGISGNRLQIFSDNPNADVAIGYDAAGTFNERFAVKPNGALAVNGNTGNAGQVLQSNGNNSTATWGSSTNQLFNNVYSFGLTSNVLASGNFVQFNLPGLNQNITLTQTSKVLVAIHAAGYNNGCFGCGEAVMQFELQINNGPTFQYKSTHAPNSSSFDEDSGFRMTTLGPGVHNFRMFAQHNSGGDVNIYSDGVAAYGTRMMIIVIPQ